MNTKHSEQSFLVTPFPENMNAFNCLCDSNVLIVFSFYKNYMQKLVELEGKSKAENEGHSSIIKGFF